MDYTCPFCKRMFQRLTSEVGHATSNTRAAPSCVPRAVAWLRAQQLRLSVAACVRWQVIPWINKTHPGKVSITAYTHVQPWHPQGACSESPRLAALRSRAGVVAAAVSLTRAARGRATVGEAVLAVDQIDKSAYVR